MHDPSLSLIVSPVLQVTWHSAFIITRHGQRIAIVGRYDTDNIVQTGAYPEVIGYDQSIRPALVETLNRLNPQCIAINYQRERFGRRRPDARHVDAVVPPAGRHALCGALHLGRRHHRRAARPQNQARKLSA